MKATQLRTRCGCREGITGSMRLRLSGTTAGSGGKKKSNFKHATNNVDQKKPFAKRTSEQASACPSFSFSSSFSSSAFTLLCLALPSFALLLFPLFPFLLTVGPHSYSIRSLVSFSFITSLLSCTCNPFAFSDTFSSYSSSVASTLHLILPRNHFLLQ